MFYDIFIIMYFLLLMFVKLLILSLLMYMIEVSMMMEWLLVEMNSLNLEIYFLFDWISLLFISFIFLISAMIMMYSWVYMAGDKFMSRFIWMVVLFVGSMIFMIISPNIISILLGWDGLGLTSYCLVIYYQNYMSYNSGMVTVLSNRVGDIGLLMAISLMVVGGSWNVWMLNSNHKMVMFMLIIAAVTKSAQIPFSAWLPMAMAAPTPVSALVHSSTLVTAGIYLMIRFNEVLMGGGLNIILYFLSILTMFMAGSVALVENDLKKIIALSTLSQLGLMMMILSFGFSMVAFYHLLTHAIFKSMLFMCAGVIIHSFKNCQDIRLLGKLNEVMPFTMMSMFISNLALCGFPFLAGFYSKDLIMELMYSSGGLNMMMFMSVISLTLTVLYSIRLYYYMFFCEMKFYSYYNFSENGLMCGSMMILIIMSIIVGAVVNWMFFFDNYLNYLSINIKMITLLFSMMGVVVSYFLVIYNFLSMMFYLSYYLSSMWFLNFLFFSVYKLVNEIGVECYKFDKTWMEFSMIGLAEGLIIHSKMMMSKMYMMGYWFIFVCMIIQIIY